MVVVITGVTSGIGKALTEKYIENGHRVIGIARREEILRKMKRRYDKSFDYISWDISEISRLDKLLNRIEDKNRDIDLLINNAGTGSYGEFCETEIEREIKMIDVNIVALTYLTKAYLKKMLEKNRGGIINVASTAAFQGGGPLMAAYYGSKSYVLTLDEGIRGELKQRVGNKVRVMTLCPGPTTTEFIGMGGSKRGLEDLYTTSPKEVARECYEGYLKEKEIVVPGRVNRITLFIGKFLPVKIQRDLVYRIQKKKRP